MRLEREWDNPAVLLFRSEEHGVMAIADAYPRMALSCVIAPRYGTPGVRSDFNKLPRRTKRLLFEVADAIGEKIVPHCDTSQRVATRIHNFSIYDHPHIIVSAARHHEVVGDHDALPILGMQAVQNTVEVLRFSQVEAAGLDARLDSIA